MRQKGLDRGVRILKVTLQLSSPHLCSWATHSCTSLWCFVTADAFCRNGKQKYLCLMLKGQAAAHQLRLRVKAQITPTHASLFSCVKLLVMLCLDQDDLNRSRRSSELKKQSFHFFIFFFSVPCLGSAWSKYQLHDGCEILSSSSAWLMVYPLFSRKHTFEQNTCDFLSISEQMFALCYIICKWKRVLQEKDGVGGFEMNEWMKVTILRDESIVAPLRCRLRAPPAHCCECLDNRPKLSPHFL